MGGSVFSWPFRSLVLTPLQTAVPLWKTLFIWLHVAFVLMACWVVGRRALVPAAERSGDLWLCVWLLGNSLFAACVGNVWGFHEFDRYIIPALPPALWAFERWLPRRGILWLPIAILSFAAAAFGLSHG